MRISPLRWEVWRIAAEGVSPQSIAADVPLELEGARLLLTDDGLRLEPVLGNRVLLNDVQVRTGARLRSGDQVTSGPDTVVVRASQAVAVKSSRIREAHELETMRELLLEVPGQSFASAILRGTSPEDIAPHLMPGDVCAPLGPNTVECFLPATSREAAHQRLSSISASHVVVAGAREGVDEALALDAGLLDALFGTTPTVWMASRDPLWERALSLFDRFPSGTWVISGEAGAGKEVLARAAHERWAANKPFVLWRANKDGPLEDALSRARGGTLCIRARGGRVDARVEGHSARVVWLTRDAHAEGTKMVRVPALRDRPEDILAFAEFFLARMSRALEKGPLHLSASAADALVAYDFLGNVRELKVALGRAAFMTAGGEIQVTALPQRMWRGALHAPVPQNFRSAMRATEREALLVALGQTRWNVTETAKQLGLPRRTVVYRMSRLGLTRPVG
ncbi:MAG: helix-turn-helix domain-containing protein [Myxococcaceae bacterium]